MTKWIIVLLSLTLGCAQLKDSQQSHQSWIDQVNEHHGKTEGGRRLLQSMKAHGGLKNWLSAGILHFRWTYYMRDRGPKAIVDTIQSVDPHSLKNIHHTPDGKVKFGWDGKNYWSEPKEHSFPIPTQFWSLTPYYFVGIPFVFADLGSSAELLIDQIVFEGKKWDQVKVTFSADSGDAPDDYYILMINPKTHRVGAVRYIVTSPLVAKKGPLPEKMITLESQKQLGGVWLATSHRSYKMNHGKIDKKIRDAKVSDLKWLQHVDFQPQSPGSY